MWMYGILSLRNWTRWLKYWRWLPYRVTTKLRFHCIHIWRIHTTLFGGLFLTHFVEVIPLALEWWTALLSIIHQHLHLPRYLVDVVLGTVGLHLLPGLKMKWKRGGGRREITIGVCVCVCVCVCMCVTNSCKQGHVPGTEGKTLWEFFLQSRLPHLWR